MREVFSQLPDARRADTTRVGSASTSRAAAARLARAWRGPKSRSIFCDVYVPCEVCAGKRYNAQTLACVTRRRTSPTCSTPASDELRRDVRPYRRSIAFSRRSSMCLGTMKIARAAPTMSGGEVAAGLKLSRELGQRVKTGRTLYVLRRAHHRPAFRRHEASRRALGPPGRRRAIRWLVIEHNPRRHQERRSVIDLGPEAARGRLGSSPRARPSSGGGPASYTGPILGLRCSKPRPASADRPRGRSHSRETNARRSQPAGADRRRTMSPTLIRSVAAPLLDIPHRTVRHCQRVRVVAATCSCASSFPAERWSRRGRAIFPGQWRTQKSSLAQ